MLYYLRSTSAICGQIHNGTDIDDTLDWHNFVDRYSKYFFFEKLPARFMVGFMRFVVMMTPHKSLATGTKNVKHYNSYIEKMQLDVGSEPYLSLQKPLVISITSSN